MQSPLLLLPGMMCDARLFQPQFTAFSATRPVMTAPLSGASTIPELAAHIFGAAPERFALAGLSMGGIVAMEMARQAPERIERIALLDTNPLAEPPDRAAAREPQIADVRAGGLRRVMRDEMKPNYLADGPNQGAILDLCMAMAETLGPAVFESQSRALQIRPDQSDTLRGLNIPALVLCGAEDSLCPLERHTLMRDLLPDATLEVIEGAGHLPTLEQPDATNAALLRWLER
ncbi:alpha/beta fold hydrolase [Gymnodinialimonas hymeniacidonis]|uniref:alpha/beta fold hydrolase n=1 Tax=Gymnodinialimonas hymeniacidonis TaxID=3126508 RepID=UPI0034C5D3B3